MSTTADVRRYYDVNHRSFLRFGTGRKAGVIHRAVWAPGVETRLQALHWVHELVLAELEELGGAENARVLDFGCGAGASLRYLVERGVGSGVGISNSPAQIATALERNASFEARLEFFEGDFTDPLLLDSLAYASDHFDLVFAIESFAHVPSPERFFASAVRFLRPGGRLVLIDDLRVDRSSKRERSQRQARARRRDNEGANEGDNEERLRRFEQGWNLAPLRSSGQVRKVAKRAGLEVAREVDLTPHLEKRTLRNRTVAVTVKTLQPLARSFPAFASRSPFWSNLSGGHALQELLQRGLVEYRCLSFARTGRCRL